MDDFGRLFQQLKFRPDPWHFLHAGRPLMGIQVQRNPIRVIKYCLLGLFPGKKIRSSIHQSKTARLL